MVVTTALRVSRLFLQLQFPPVYVNKTKELVPGKGCLMIISTDITVNRMGREFKKI
jgi:hypothetical protein